MKKLLFSIILSIICTTSVLAIDIDSTVDDEIRQNYQADKLIDENLPELPKILQTPSYKESVPDSVDEIKKATSPAAYRGVLKSGTKITVINDNSVADWLRKGSKVVFHSKQQVYSKGLLIPAGTKFYAEVEESHSPQISCNGGLVVLRVHSVAINGSVTPIEGYITKANSKKIFLNNIKGKRTYLKTLWKKTGFGRNLFDKMLNLTVNLGGDGATLILSPFPVCYGTIVLGVNTLASPVLAFFSKGGHVNIPVGTEFVIKVKEDVGLYY